MKTWMLSLTLLLSATTVYANESPSLSGFYNALQEGAPVSEEELLSLSDSPSTTRYFEGAHAHQFKTDQCRYSFVVQEKKVTSATKVCE